MWGCNKLLRTSFDLKPHCNWPVNVVEIGSIHVRMIETNQVQINQQVLHPMMPLLMKYNKSLKLNSLTL